MHLTALILLPLFFFIDKKYNPLILIIGLIGLFVLFSLVYPMIEDYALLDGGIRNDSFIQSYGFGVTF